MKKLFFSLAIILTGFFMLGTSHVFAATAAAAVTPNPADGTVQPGGACTTDTNCADTATQTYGCYPEGNGTCTPDGDAPAASSATSPVSDAAATPAAPATSGSGNFVPLTNLPVFTTSKNLTTAPDLATFFNQLYKYCIGIAATLAVLQIMRAGIMYMGGDSITETKDARRLIGSSVGGLILVLSPYVIFSIINPDILKINLGSDLQGLNPGQAAAPAAASTPAPISPSNPGASVIQSTGQVNAACTKIPDGTYLTGTGSDLNSQIQCCTHQTGVTCVVNTQDDMNSKYYGQEFCSCS